jgi:hypothetical protein
MRIRISNYMSDLTEELIEKLQEYMDRIKYLEGEVIRLKLLLEGENTMMNSLPTRKPGK